jgi:hypothetical protein
MSVHPMALQPQDEEFIEKIKHDLGIDIRLGDSLSKLVEDRGRDINAAPLTPQQGEDLSKRAFNPTIRRILNRLT